MRNKAIFLCFLIFSFCLLADAIRNEVSFHNFMQNKTNYDYVKEYQPKAYASYKSYDSDIYWLRIIFITIWVMIYIASISIVIEKWRESKSYSS